ncbi:MAG: hypothetical protein V2A74_01825 [bacterium]
MGVEIALRGKQTNLRVLVGSCLGVIAVWWGILGCAGVAFQQEQPKNVGKVVLHWRTNDLENTYGFNVYRSKSRNGLFAKVNESPILAKESELGQYEYVDKPLPMGETFYYYIEAVSMTRETQKLTVTMPAQVKPLDQ